MRHCDYLAPCSDPGCIAAAEGVGDHTSCRKRHNDNPSAIVCRYNKPEPNLERDVSICPATPQLQNTTARHWVDEMTHKKMLGEDVTAATSGKKVAQDSKTTAATIEHNGKQMIMQLELVERTLIPSLQSSTSLQGCTINKSSMRTRVSFPEIPQRSTASSFFTGAFLGMRHGLALLFNWLFTLAVAVCSLHTDAAYNGYYGPHVRECLTVFSRLPVFMVVMNADMRIRGQASLINRCKVRIYILKNGDTLVMEGAAGQVCAHLVVPMPGDWCVRVRTFWSRDQQ